MLGRIHFSCILLIGLLAFLAGCAGTGKDPAPAGTDRGGSRFVVTDWGADPNGERDSTAALQAAIAAAGSAASERRRTEVLIPKGTYKVMPSGILHLRFWEKANGQWTLVADEPDDTRVGSWLVGTEDPGSPDGRDGDYYINRKKNQFWRWNAGRWEARGPILCQRGDGWRSAFFPPVAEDPESLWIQYRLTHTVPNRAVLRVTPDMNHISIIQEEGAVLDFRCWGDVHPMDYTVSQAKAGENLKANVRVYLRDDGKWWLSNDGTATLDGVSTANKERGKPSQVVVRSAIPPEKWFPEFAGTRNSAHRGNLIVFDRDRRDKRDFHGIWFVNPVWQGNCTVNYKHSWYTLYHDLDEWDINNKGIVLTWGADGNLFDIRLLGGRISGFRGEQVFAGGGLRKEILVDGTEISHSNASAISVSGHLTVRNVYLHHNYNGMENFAHASSKGFVEVFDTRIDLTGGGKYGIVHLGEPQTHLLVDGLEVTGGDGMYFDAAAHNVEIRNSTFTDCGIAVRLWNINARTYKLTPAWRDFTFRNVRVIARQRDVNIGIFQAQTYQALGRWEIDGLQAVGENGHEVKKAISLASRNSDSEVWIRRSDLAASPVPVSGEGVVPHYGQGNRIPPISLNVYRDSGQVLELRPQALHYVLTFVPDPPPTGLELGPLNRYYPGYTVQLSNETRNGMTVPLQADPHWNSFSSDISIEPGQTLSLRFGENGRFQLVNPED